MNIIIFKIIVINIFNSNCFYVTFVTSARLVMSAIQANTYTKEWTNTRARPPSAITCRRMAVTFLVFQRILEF